MSEHKINFEHHYQLMREILWSEKFVGKTVAKIRWKINILMAYTCGLDGEESKTELEYLRTATKEFALVRIWSKYMEKKPYLKYTDKYSLSTYIQNFMNFRMGRLLRDHKPHSVGSTDYRKFGGDMLNNKYINYRTSLEDLTDFIDNTPNPEERVMMKDAMEKFFTAEELANINSGEVKDMTDRIRDFMEFWERQ